MGIKLWLDRCYARKLIQSSKQPKRQNVLRQKETLFKRIPFAAEQTVLELGPGAGVNLKYFPKNIHWIGVEPNTFFFPALEQQLEEKGMEEWSLHACGAEQLPAVDNSMDVVVSTIVFCSVEDPQKVLKEALRVLKPGGMFVFMEHIGAPKGTWRRFIQEVMNPFWRAKGGGCNLTREPLVLIEKAGFKKIESWSFEAENYLPYKWVAGIAQK